MQPKNKVTQIRRSFVKWRVRSILFSLARKKFEKEKFTYFEKVEDALLWGEATFASWIDKIQACRGREFVVKSDRYLKTPYQAIDWYCGYGHEEVNHYLRGSQNYTPLRFVTDIVDHLDEELKSSSVSMDIVVVRWVRKDAFQNIYGEVRRGTRIVDKGYMSTSLHLFYDGPHDSRVRDIENHVLLVIKLRRGNHGLYVCPVRDRYREQELLLSRNTSLEIVQVIKIPFGTDVLVCMS